MLTDNDSRILFIYLFANPAITLTGIYNLDIEICEKKVKSKRDFAEVLKELVDLKMVKWDAEEEMIFVINRFKLINNKSAKIISGAITELNRITHPFKNNFISLYKEFFGNYKPILNGFDDSGHELLNKEQVASFMKLGWQKERIKKFYMDRHFTEQKIDEVLSLYFPNMR